MVWTPPHPQPEFIGEGDTPTCVNLIDNGRESPCTGRMSSPPGAGKPSLDKRAGAATSFRVPRDARPGDQLQIVAEARDVGTPPLNRH